MQFSYEEKLHSNGLKNIFDEALFKLCFKYPEILSQLYKIPTQISYEYQQILIHAYYFKNAKYTAGFLLGVGMASLGILAFASILTLSPYLSIGLITCGAGVMGFFAYTYRQDAFCSQMAKEPFHPKL